ncbi:OLC1v1032292C1 [Oldenlandia corymbosa var. corymbosa]|uniref:OLC1v1032292C1 n=1 Tax=Oldenlandia corymbosa var. corymbosa TaxID=529605 RepID=A0AAV1CKR7_OLDCO|nr:OLC1v1032292C1 [Oldenlandia corymbosa var. corymbosa]
MVSLQRKLTNVMRGKNARACDNCISKRARWYCPADDAFLCQLCDGSVHSANPLARRHERVRLKTSSLKPNSKEFSLEISVPSWHHGFTKKARTPRGGKNAKSSKFDEPEKNGINPVQHLVPEICCDEMETSIEENEDEQLLYRVPIFDPFVAELCTATTCSNSPNSNEGAAANENLAAGVNDQSTAMMNDGNNYDDRGNDLNHHHQLHGSLPSEMELAEFAADVESLLGKGLDDESFDIEGLGFSDCKLENDCLGENEKVVFLKLEDEGGEQREEVVDCSHDQIDMMMGRDQPFELSFDYDSPMTCEEDSKGDVVVGRTAAAGTVVKEDDHHQMIMGEDCIDIEIGDIDHQGEMMNNNANNGGKILLRLDYDGVISAWNDQKSPWTAGERPELDSLDCWPDCMGRCGTIHYPYGEVGMYGNPAMMDGGREARVSRYREKRRTRLFAKKIRYEVRKLNAEKRPRMKGRFVKRSNFSPTTAFPVLTK